MVKWDSDLKRRVLEIFQRMAKGDTRAMREMCKVVWGPLSAIVRWRLGPHCEEVDDILQEVLLSLWKHRGEPIEDPLAYLKSACRRRCKEVEKRKRRRLPLPDDAKERFPAPPSDAPVFETDEEVEAWRRKLDDLSRRILELVEKGLRAKEIAKVLGCSLRTIERRLKEMERSAKWFFRS